jgi:hypothetical protein
MPGRTSYSTSHRTSYSTAEINSARFALAEQLTAYTTLTGEITGDTAQAALADFEPLFFNNLVLVLDRYFVHRLHPHAGTDPLIEVAVIADSLLHHHAVLAAPAAYRPADSIVKLDVGDDIRLTAAEFESLSGAFFTALEAHFPATDD